MRGSIYTTKTYYYSIERGAVVAHIKDYIDQFFTADVRVTKRAYTALFIVYFALSNTYYLVNPFFFSLVGNDVFKANAMFVVLDIGIALSLVFGGFLLKDVSITKIISLWSATSIFLTLLLQIINDYNLQLFLIFIYGIVLGLSILLFNIYFRGETRIEERGRVGGTIVFLSLILGSVLSLFLLEQRNSLFLLLFLSIGVTIIHRLKPKKEFVTKYATSYDDNKNFLLYFIPWIIFCINNNVFSTHRGQQLTQMFPDIYQLAGIVNFIGGSIGALFGGFLSDRLGRKPVLIYGLTSFGITSILVGLIGTTEGFLLLYLINGFSWGIFLVLYYMFLWGEFDNTKLQILYYSAGLSTYHFSRALGVLVTPYLSHISIYTATLASAMMIFLSIIPLFYTRETLSLQYKIEIGDLKKYITRIKQEIKETTKEERDESNYETQN
jgi:MFS family permease